MNIFWIIAALMAGFILLNLFTGRVRIRGRVLADRDVEPKTFWFCQIAFGIGLITIIMEAVSPPY